MINAHEYISKLDQHWTSRKMRKIFKKKEGDMVKHPLCADVYITDCERQDFHQFAGQYVWTVKIKLWHGPIGYYPHLGDDPFDLSFDIPADWVTSGWEVSTNSSMFNASYNMAEKQRQQMKAVDMNANPLKSAPWLIKRAVDHGILERPVLELL